MNFPGVDSPYAFGPGCRRDRGGRLRGGGAPWDRPGQRRAGNLPAELGDAARRAVEAGVVVLVSSRAGAGRVPVGRPRWNPGAPSFRGPGPLNPQRARVILMLALAVGREVEEVARLGGPRMEGFRGGSVAGAQDCVSTSGLERGAK